MSAGPKGEGGLDDATGASGAAGGAGYKQTSRLTQLSKYSIEVAGLGSQHSTLGIRVCSSCGWGACERSGVVPGARLGAGA